MAILVGDKSTFAIEASVERATPAPFGGVRVWLGHRYVGAYEDIVPILTFFARIKRVPDLQLDTGVDLLQSSEALFDGVMQGTMKDGDKYRLGLGESFDDFFVLGFRDGDIVRIVWLLHEAPFFSYPDYPNGIQSALVSVKFFEQVVNRFADALAEQVLRSKSGSSPSPMN